MSQFKDIAKFFNIKTLEAIAFSVLSIDYIQEIIIDLSQEKLSKGEDNEGNDLHTDKSDPRIGGGIYSPSNEKNFSQDFVDLHNSGKFYNSFRVIVKKTFFELKGEFKKGSGNNIYDNFQGTYSDQKTFENAILGLRNEDLSVFIQKVFLPAAIENFIKMVSSVIK